MKLSIIIPYYETFDLTMALINGLKGQKRDNVEIFLVDDYCKGEFSEMKDELASYNIKLLENEVNIGQCRARKRAIALATGEYIGFIDSDDMVTPDYIDVLLNAIDKYGTDIINFNWLDINTNEVYRKPHNPAFWKAIYKRNKLIEFKEDIPYGGEDYYFQKELEENIAKGDTIVYLDRVLYLYNSNREGSLTWKFLHKED